MASGDTLCVFTPQQAETPASNYATFDVRNNHWVLDYDDTTEETVSFEAVLPRHYAGGGITADLYWMATSATSGAVKWGGAFERHQASTTDLSSDHFATEQANTGTTAGTAGQPKVTSIAFTDGAQINSLAISEHFRFKVARKAADGADTLVGDAELLAVQLRET